MRQYTTPEQTAKLIELGFEKPKNTISKQVAKRKIGYGIHEWEDAGEEGSYSIGELIEMLPKGIGDNYLDISSPFGEDDDWLITYGRQYYDEWEDLYTFINKEFIDALYDMAVKLKEEGVI